jgi:hypothetical protein
MLLASACQLASRHPGQIWVFIADGSRSVIPLCQWKRFPDGKNKAIYQ